MAAGGTGVTASAAAILEAVTRAVKSIDSNFVVIDATSRGVVDATRRELDDLKDSDGDSAVHILCKAKDRNSDRALVGLKKLIEVGVDPDRMNNQKRRPAHMCSIWACPRLTRVIFNCRPDLKATNEAGNTPMQCTDGTYSGDSLRPDQPPLRLAVKKILVQEDYESGFPTIAELSCHQDWYAVKNLIRRQVVPASEFFDDFGNKTALGWAEYYQEEKMASELQYYAQLVLENQSEEGAPSIEGPVQTNLPSLDTLRTQLSTIAQQLGHLQQLGRQDGDNSMDCVICFEEKRACLFGCGHLVTCSDCASKVESCPVCRKEISSRQNVRIYD